jgi:tripartite ATP-independent transporter DctP family solute receptor
MKASKLCAVVVFTVFVVADAFAGGGTEKMPQTASGRPSEVQIRYDAQKWGGIPDKIDPNKSAQTILVTASVHPAPHPEDMALRYFHRRLEELTAGKVSTNYFPGGMLAQDARDVLDLNVKGDIDITRHDEAALNSIVPTYEILSSLFLFSNPTHVYKFMERPEFSKRFDRDLAKNNLVCFGSFSFGRHLYSKQPVKSLDDLRGLKVRTMEIPVVMRAWNELGANSTPLPFSDLFTGLQTGLIGAGEGSATAYYSNKFYEVAKFFEVIYYKQSVQTYTVNKKKYDSLITDSQKAIMQAGKDAVRLTREIYADWEDDIMDSMVKAGVEIINQNDILDYSKWIDRIRDSGVNNDLIQRTDPAFEDLIEQTR